MEPTDKLTPQSQQPENINDLYALLSDGLRAYNQSLEVRKNEIATSHAQWEIERMKAEKGYELNRQSIETRQAQFEQILKFEQQQFVYKFWAVVGFAACYVIIVVVLLATISDASERTRLLTQALLVALGLLGGKGLMSIFDRSKPKPPKPKE